MHNVRQARPTFLLLLYVILLAFPFSGIAQTSLFSQSDNYASDILYWNDPVSTSKSDQNPLLRSTTTIGSDDDSFKINGAIFDATNHSLIVGAQIFCLDKDKVVVASTQSNANGSYQFQLPDGKYTISVSMLKYSAVSKAIDAVQNSLFQLNFDMVPLITRAGFNQVLNGSLAEGGLNDITLENSKVAMSISDGSLDQQLGLATKGKPIDLSTTTGVDGFDWINLPLISTQKLSGIPGTLASMSKNVQFNTVQILNSTPTFSKVLATGQCTELPLLVKNIYVVKPDKEWFEVTTTIQNVGDSAVSFWLGDAMDNDEYGQTSIYPINRFNTSVIVSAEMGLDEFIPAEPWMGCFGKSNQVFGIFYTGDFAKNFLISANTFRTVSQKYITIQTEGTYTLTRKIAAVPVGTSQTHSTALRSSFAASDDDNWGLESRLYLSETKANPGDVIECTMVITNLSKYNSFDDVGATLVLPAFWKTSADTLFFGTLGPKETVEAIWHVIPTEGSGNTIIAGSALAWNEPFTYSEQRIYVNGEGWYSGDNHMHSTFSDGIGTVPDLIQAAKTLGLSFISVTDHNTTRQDSAVKANSRVDFLAMTGCEITPNYKAPNNWGHAVSLFSNVTPKYSNTPSQANAQAIVDNINALNDGKGFAIMAHPYLKGCPWMYPNVTGFRGEEVWSCFTPISSSYSKLAFNLWDKKNLAGLKHYGFAESDAHNLDMVGKPHIVAHLKNLSENEILNAMNAGQFYGSDGPALRFYVDTVMMGGSLRVPSKRLVKISMKSYSPQGIDSMYLIKNGVVIGGFIYPNFTKNAQEVIYDEAVPGDFYRMECTDRWSLFAYSNPVFIVPSEQVTPQIVDTISTGLSDKKLVLKIGAFPNPAQDYIQLRTSLPTRAVVTIYDTNSKVWLRASLNNETEKMLDVRSLPRGLYIVKVNENRFKLILN